jgi:hypothetical protein
MAAVLKTAVLTAPWVQIPPLPYSGCSSVWIERCFWEAEVVGSNPITPIHKLTL